MKSVSFLRSAWKKREQSAPSENHSDYVRADAQLHQRELVGSSSSVAGANTLSKAGPEEKDLPFLTLSVGTPRLQEDLSRWIQVPRIESPGTSISASKARNDSHERPSMVHKESISSNTKVNTRNSHGAALNLHHGPPPNSSHGPPRLNLQTSIASQRLPPPPNPSLRRSHRPPQIIVYPPANRHVSIASKSVPTSPRSPRVKFVLPQEGALQDAARSLSTLHDLENTDSGSQKSPAFDRPDMREGKEQERVCSNCLSRERKSKRDCQCGFKIIDDDDNIHYPRAGCNPAASLLEIPGVGHHDVSSPFVGEEHNGSRLKPPSESQFSKLDHDPISLFPIPPPLVIRKKVPRPLILRPTPTIAPLPPSPGYSSPGYSSSESTPPLTPRTSRPQWSSTPTSPTFSAKYPSSRLAGSIPPPPSSPPTSPLPSPPATYPPSAGSADYGNALVPNIKPLRIVKSSSQLRQDATVIGSVTHRVTSSEPISEWPQSDRIPARRRVFSRPEAYIRSKKEKHVSHDIKEASVNGIPPAEQVQWGYAL